MAAILSRPQCVKHIQRALNNQILGVPLQIPLATKYRTNVFSTPINRNVLYFVS